MKTIKGLAVPFNTQSTPLAQDNIFFTEVIHDGAFEDTIFNDVRLLVEHNDENLLARQSADTLRLYVTDNGLEFDATLDETDEYTAQILKRIENGLLKNMSIRFLSQDPIYKQGDVYTRDVYEIGLVSEISIVGNPAYTETTVEIVDDSMELPEPVAYELDSKRAKEMTKEVKIVDKEKDKKEIQDQGAEAESVDVSKEDQPTDDSETKDVEEKEEKPAEQQTNSDSEEKEEGEKPSVMLETIVKAIENLEKVFEKAPAPNANAEKVKPIQDGKRGNNAMEIKKEVHEKNETEKFMDYIRGKGAIDGARAGLKTTDGAPIIPEDVIYVPKDEVKEQYDLTQHINEVSVHTATGKYPVMQVTGDTLHTAEELAQNPELAGPQFTTVQYAVQTYRGALQYSEEMLEDATNLQGLLNKHVNRMRQNTYNKAISDVLKTATKETVAAAGDVLDSIKTILNTKLDPGYTDRRILASQTFYNTLDQLKDSTGRYMLQPDPTNQTKGFIAGVPVYIIADDLIGENSAFIGDSKQFCSMFVRSEMTALWVQNEVYGQSLSIGTRFDTKAVDTKAGFYVTVTAAKAK